MLNAVIANAIYTNNAAFAQGGVPFIPILGFADTGPLNTPTQITQANQAASIFGSGQLVQWASAAIAKYRLPVLAVRMALDPSSAVSTFSAVGRSTGHGTSVVTVDAASTTEMNTTVVVQIMNGGTVGVTGITYAVSTDNGQAFGATTALSTSTSITIPLGVVATLVLDLTTASLITGETISVTASYITKGSYGSINSSQYPLSGNTAVASLTAGNYPDDDYEVIIQFITGGTLGTAGITYRVSISGALSAQDWSQTFNLGTALTILVPGTGSGGTSGAMVTLGTNGETIGTNAQLSFRCYGPTINSAAVVAGLNALFLNKQNWERVAIAPTFTSSDAAVPSAIDAVFAANYRTTIHGEKSWIGNFRMQNSGESTAAYMTAGQTFATAAMGNPRFGSLCFGDCKIISAVTGYLHKRPISMLVALELTAAGLSIDIARTDRPGLGCLLADTTGNPDCYDDGLYNGTMDGFGYIALRGDQPEGIFVGNPRMFVPPGTNIPMTYHRDLLNLHTRYAKDVLRKELSVGLRADVKTGLLQEDEYDAIEKKVNTIENSLLLPYISGQKVSVSRTDNLNNQPTTMNVSGKLVTLIYPKTILWTDQIVASL